MTERPKTLTIKVSEEAAAVRGVALYRATACEGDDLRGRQEASPRPRSRGIASTSHALGSKPGLEQLPILRFWQTMLDLYNHPRTGRRAKNLIAHIAGAEPSVLERIVTADEIERAGLMSFEELANDALAAKLEA